jgi:acetyltransferase-like isoleucine patch superfamily enzyme
VVTCELIAGHKAFSGSPHLGKDGFTLPNLVDLERIEINEDSRSRLLGMGINLIGPLGLNNSIYIDQSSSKVNINVSYNKRSDNIIILNGPINLKGVFNFESGDNNIVVINSGNASMSITATFRYGCAGLFLGGGGSAPGTNFWIEGPDKSIQIGDDFMFSWGIWIRTADSHGIVDLKSGNLINHPKSVIVGSHVWLGQDVILMPGAKVGAGSVIGARSIVTGTIPARSVAVGAPAKVVRRDVSWTRQAVPSADLIKRLQSQIFDDI